MNALALLRPPALPARASIGLLLLRLVAGLAFMYHGWGKIQHPFSWMGPDAAIPGFFQMLAAVSEFGGGLAWMLGLLTPLASFGLACTMAVATHLHAVVMKQPFVQTSQDSPGSYELAALYFCISILFLLAGPGRFSIDQLLFNRKPATVSAAAA